MIDIIINNNKITIKADNSILIVLQNSFTFPDFSKCFVYGKFDKTRIVNKSFLKIRKNEGYLPIGFRQDLLLNPILSENVNVLDLRKSYDFDFTTEIIINCLDYIELRDYQIEAIQSSIKNINGICKLVTSAGKTEIFLALCKLLNLKTLILFQRIDLAHQTLQRALKAKLDSGIVQGTNIDEDHQIIMTTVQSAHKLQNTYEMVIIDEVQHAGSTQYQKVLQKQEFVYRLGFSATPFVKDKYKTAKIKSYIGNIIYELPAGYLIEEKKIAEPIINIIEINKPGRIYGEKWVRAEKYGIIENTFRNEKIAELVNEVTGQCLVLVKKIKQGELLKELIPDSYFLHGKKEVELRKDIVKDFETKKLKCIIASTIFDEGISINVIENLIIAGGGCSYVKTIQRIGRGLRIAKNKNTVNVYDFMDNQNKLTQRHSEERIEFYKKEGFNKIFYKS